MKSLNSLLIGFYTLLSYSYSQWHTYLTLGSWKRDISVANVLSGYCGKTEKKQHFLLLFSKPTDSNLDPGLLQNTHLYTDVLVFAVCRAEARDTPTLSRILALV